MPAQWYRKKNGIREKIGAKEYFFWSQREIVLEGVSDLERASCADRCFFFALATWTSGPGGSTFTRQDFFFTNNYYSTDPQLLGIR